MASPCRPGARSRVAATLRHDFLAVSSFVAVAAAEVTLWRNCHDELAGANSAGLKALVEKYSEPALPYEA